MSRKLELVREEKLFRLLPGRKESSRLEASGIALVDDTTALVVFDNLNQVARINLSLKRRASNRLLPAPSLGSGFEDIAIDHRHGRAFCLRRTESACRSRRSSRTMPRSPIATGNLPSSRRRRRACGWPGSTRKRTPWCRVSDAVYRFPSKSYGNVEGIAWLSRDTLVAVSDRKKRGQPARCAEKDQSIHLFRIPAG